jgi:hyperosmotically inducible periplasmic protein
MQTLTLIGIAGAGVLVVSSIVRAQVAGGADGAIDAAGQARGALESAASREPTLDVTDAEIGVQVQAALSRGIGPSGVRSEVKNGVATLQGSVASEDERERAERLARDVEGVRRVRNELVVEPATPAAQRVEEKHSEGPPAEAIEARLRGDARLATRDIDVHTKGSVVTLTGEVATNDEREAAGRIATEAAEGTEVRNRIVVASAPVAPSQR